MIDIPGQRCKGTWYYKYKTCTHHQHKDVGEGEVILRLQDHDRLFIFHS